MSAALEAALRACAEGACCAEAAAELLIASSWLHRADFAGQFISAGRSPGGGRAVAVVDWPSVITALGTALPCSGGERRMLQVTASLAGGIPVDLRDALPGLDSRNIQLLVKAVLHASGQHQVR